MAILAISAIGAGLGAATLGTGIVALGLTGTSIGWMLGGVAAGFLFPPKGSSSTQDGPRITDNRIQASTYGQSIPKVYGRARIAGNLIWSSDIIETAHTSTQSQGGGKGGGGGSSVTTTTYSYHAHLAVGVCEGAIAGIRKIWANGRLIYNVGDAADIATIYASNSRAENIEIYTGSAVQPVNALIESYQGAGNVPAYRHLAYIVFNDFQLEDFGNGIPGFEFEVLSASSGAVVSGPSLGPFTFTAPGGTSWAMSQDGSTSPQGNSVANGFTHGVDSEGRFTRSQVWVTRDGSDYGLYAEVLGDLQGVNLKRETYALDIDDYLATGVWWVGGGPALRSGGWQQGDRPYAVFTDNNTSSARPAFVWDYTRARLIQIANSLFVDGLSIWQPVRACALNGDHLYIKTWIWNGDACRWWYVDLSVAAPVAIDLGACAMGDLPFADGEAWYVAKGSSISGASGNAIKTYAHGTLTEIRSATSTGIGQLTGLSRASNGFVTEERPKLYRTTDDGVRSELGTVAAQYFFAWVYGVYDKGTWVSPSTGAAADITDNWFGIAENAGSSPALSTIVSDLCLQAGLTAGDITVASLTDNVRGYVKGKRSTLRGALEPLMMAFHFDGVESDGKLKFVKRGSAAAITFDNDDLAARGEGASATPPIAYSRSNDLELPNEIAVLFFNDNSSYQQGAQYARRLVAQADSQPALELPIVLTDAEAKQIADARLYYAWSGRDQYEWSSGREYAEYEPTDVVGIPFGGDTLTVRVVRREEGANGSIKWAGEADDATIITQTATTQAAVTDTDTVGVPGPTDLRLLDIPLLRDGDNTYGHYAAAGGYLGGWKGAVTFVSRNGGSTYENSGAGTFIGQKAIGAANAALGATTLWEQFDHANTVQIQVTNGQALSSSTEAGVLDGANAALLGNEIIQFITATDDGDFKYTLSGLLRGRLGTDWAIPAHAIADRFVELSPDSLRFILSRSADLNVELRYKGVSIGNSIESAESQVFTNTGANQKPLSPAHLTAGLEKNGDITIRWVRRTRLNAVWRDYVDAVLGEESESYSIDIYNEGSPTEILRTLTAVTNSVTYASAQIEVDFGSPQPSSLRVIVYQISAQVGRGFPADSTLTL